MDKIIKETDLKICLVYNFGQHYRTGIYMLMNNYLNVDFYFGDRFSDVKKIDYSKLNGFKKELRNRSIYKAIYWQQGAVRLFFKNYNRYIILGEYYCLSTWMILILCLFSKKKVYLWSHGWYGNENFFKKIIKKIFFNLSNGIFLYGNYAKELMLMNNFNPDKLHVIYNSLDYDFQKSVRQNLKKDDIYENHFKNSFPTIIFTGRLTKVKKLDLLIKATKILKTEGIMINIVLLGQGTEFNTLKNLVNEFGLSDSVWFYGETYSEVEIGNLYYNARLCVSPGNVGLTAIHSMTYGTPVLTHNNFCNQRPEFEAILPGVTGGFFDEDNFLDLAQKIKEFLIQDNNTYFNNCINRIESNFNPTFQIKVFKKVLLGESN
jgi:glycosyltransferase involved in cell wall biosynthesis